MSQAPWYYVNADRQRQGPVPLDELRALFAAGAIGPRSLVWSEGMPQWQPLEQLAPQLGFGAGAAAPTPPPAAGTPARPPAPPSPEPMLSEPRLARAEPGYGASPEDSREAAVEQAYAASRGSATTALAIDGAEVVDAGFWKRFAALLIDALILTVATYAILFIMMIVVGAGVGGFMTMFEASATGQPPSGPLLVVFILGLYVLPFLMRWAYFTFFTASSWQATPGKRAVGIKVVDLDGNAIGKGRATGRWFAAALSYLTFYIGFLMAAFTDRKQALHDIVASTRVVDQWAYTEFPERQRRDLGGCAIAALVGISLLFVVFMVGIIAAVSLPAYQDYSQRAQVAQVVAEGRAMTTALEAFRQNTDRCPSGLDEVGLSTPANPLVLEAEVGELEAGQCTLQFSLGGGKFDGEYLWFTREDSGRWACGGSMDDKLLPFDCRG